MNNCQEVLLDKEPCYGHPECRSVSYDAENSFDPFTVDDQQAQGGKGYNWQGRGLRSGREIGTYCFYKLIIFYMLGELVQSPKSYTYESGSPLPNYNNQDSNNNLYSTTDYSSQGNQQTMTENNYRASYMYGAEDNTGYIFI